MNIIKCLGVFKNKGIIFDLEIFLKFGSGKIFYRNLLSKDILNSIYYIYNIIPLFLKNININTYDLYINIKPENFKKKGKSITLAIFLGILCELLNLKIKKNIAITGEINFNFKILPISNLKEKLNIARAFEINLIIIPKKNIYDLKKLSKKFLNFFTIILIDDLSDLIYLFFKKNIGV